jgi:RNA polymerase sigma-70 factor (ECF subfamily)
MLCSPAPRPVPYLAGAVRTFPETQQSVVTGLASDDAAVRARALEVVARVYRAPLIALVRHRWGLDSADAEDLAHDFFTQLLVKDWLRRYDPARGRFRTFLRTCLLAYAGTAYEAAGRLKRGGGVRHLPLEDADAIAGEASGDDLFEREWVRSILELSLEALRRECDESGRRDTWGVFVARDVEGSERDAPPSYAELAARFGLPVSQITNYLYWARSRLRGHVIATLRALTASEAEFREEARTLLGVAPE